LAIFISKLSPRCWLLLCCKTIYPLLCGEHQMGMCSAIAGEIFLRKTGNGIKPLSCQLSQEDISYLYFRFNFLKENIRQTIPIIIEIIKLDIICPIGITRCLP